MNDRERRFYWELFRDLLQILMVLQIIPTLIVLVGWPDRMWDGYGLASFMVFFLGALWLSWEDGNHVR